MKSKAAVLVISAIIATGFLATNLLSISAFGQKLPQSGFGQAASDFGTTGQMGTHSRANGDFPGSTPPFNSDGQNGRDGIGRVAGQNTGTGSVGGLGCTLDALAGFSGC